MPTQPVSTRKIFNTAQNQRITIDNVGFVRVDGVPIGKRVIHNGVVYLQICDKDKRRSLERGTRYPEINVKDLVNALIIHVCDDDNDIVKKNTS